MTENRNLMRFRWTALSMFLCLFINAVFAQPAPTPWDRHFKEVLPDGFDPWCGPVVGVEGSTSVVVRSFSLPNGKTAEVYYPSLDEVSTPVPGVVFVAGNPDTQVISETGRPWMHSSQAMGWARLCAENGLIAITYENDGKPVACLRVVGEWLKQNSVDIGVDSERIGTWSASDGCAAAIEEYQTGHQAFAGIRPYFGVFFYGDLMLKSDHDTSIPLMVVRVANDSWADGRLIERFVERLRERGGTVLFQTHQSGSHSFDTRGDSEETRRIIHETIEFMKSPGTSDDISASMPTRESL